MIYVICYTMLNWCITHRCLYAQYLVQISGVGIWVRIGPHAKEIIAGDNSVIDNNALGRSYCNEL